VCVCVCIRALEFRGYTVASAGAPVAVAGRPAAEAALAVLADGDGGNDAVDVQPPEEEPRVIHASGSACGGAGEGHCQLSINSAEVLRLPNDEESELYQQGGHTHHDPVDALAGMCSSM
jgi:hypothetical protein